MPRDVNSIYSRLAQTTLSAVKHITVSVWITSRSQGRGGGGSENGKVESRIERRRLNRENNIQPNDQRRLYVEHRIFRASTDGGEEIHEEKETKEENTDSESKSSDDTRANRTVLIRFRWPHVNGHSGRVACRSVTDLSDPVTVDHQLSTGQVKAPFSRSYKCIFFPTRQRAIPSCTH